MVRQALSCSGLADSKLPHQHNHASALAHKNRGRVPPNATPETIQQRVVALAQKPYSGINHTPLTELLAEREGVMLSRPPHASVV